METKTPLITLTAVTKAYATAAGDYLALRGIDLRIDPGEFVAIVGKSGSGKSTLLNIITGIDRASSGEVRVAGADLMQMPESRMASWRGRTVGIVFQFFQLLPTLTTLENVMLPMDFCHIGTLRERRERAMALLERVGLPIRPINCPWHSLVVSSSGSRLPVLWPITHRSWSPMSQPVISTRRLLRRCFSSSSNWPARAQRL